MSERSVETLVKITPDGLLLTLLNDRYFINEIDFIYARREGQINQFSKIYSLTDFLRFLRENSKFFKATRIKVFWRETSKYCKVTLLGVFSTKIQTFAKLRE